MNKKNFSVLLSLPISSTLFAAQPNVVVVLADDLGSGDISYYRRMHSEKVILETPNIDAIAKNGVSFTNAHSAAALSAPSRYSMMTGNSCFRSDYPWGVWGSYEKTPIKENQLTMSKLMKQVGYQTAFFGKWNLGGDFLRLDDSTKVYRGPRNKPEVDVDIRKIVGGGPSKQYFDYSLSLPSGIQASPYAVYENDVWKPMAKDSKTGFVSQEMMTKLGVKLDKLEGLGDLNWDPHFIGPILANGAVKFINTHANKENPFFIYYCSQAVHLPHAPANELNGIKIAGTTPSAHLDMVKELDVQMGMLIAALKKQGVYDNTVFIFTSDNGGLEEAETVKSGHKSNDIYRGHKNLAYEGGHRVPLIISYPGLVKKAAVCAEPVMSLDAIATLASITNQTIATGQAQDSKNLMPLLLNTKGAKGHDYLMLQSGTDKRLILIEDNWKLIIQEDLRNKQSEVRTPFALFDLNTNVEENEAKNLINEPEQQIRIKRMFEKYNELRK